MTSFAVDRSFCGQPKRPQKTCALLWDESLLWGIMAWRALQEAGLSSDILTAQEVRQGALADYRMLFVPGGWASNKLAALGEQGCAEIRSFLKAGGSYLGICGGAGLATREGIALLPVGRKPSAERVASFNGPIRISPAAHPIWQDVEEPIFQAWWPSQLAGHPEVRVLATYEDARPGAFSADIPVEKGQSEGWPALEASYGILLDPERLRGEPAVLEGRYGPGRVVLSLLHFDTPGDANGRVVLQNLWRYLADDSAAMPAAAGHGPPGPPPVPAPPDIWAIWVEVLAGVDDLIAAGEGHSLWRWRNPFLLQWRRGVRGLEYSALSVMTREIRNRLAPGQQDPDGTTAPPGCADPDRLRRELGAIQQQLFPFVVKAKRLLECERRYMQSRPLSPLRCEDEEIQDLREELFDSAMSHGGAFKRLIDAVDRLWLWLIRPSPG